MIKWSNWWSRSRVQYSIDFVWLRVRTRRSVVSEVGKADELAKLVELHEQGVLSDKEFKASKRQLLRPGTNFVGRNPGYTAITLGAIGIAVVLVIALVTVFPHKPSVAKGTGVVQFQNASATGAANSAVQWAEVQYKTQSTSFGGAFWALQCLAFVYDAYQYGAGMNLRNYATGVTYNGYTYPEMVWNNANFNPPKHATTDISSVPYGALVFFNASGSHASDPGDYSHVAIMGSGGYMYMTPDTLGQPIIKQSLAARVKMSYWNTFVGWWLPTGSPSSSPAPPNPPTSGKTGSVPGYPETSGGVAHTWSNYTNANGTQGQSVAGGETVGVSCKVTGFRVADGNTWWYRIASSPWDNNFYVSADAFYNNGQTSGSLANTPFVDNKVPDCTAPSSPSPSPAPTSSPSPSPTPITTQHPSPSPTPITTQHPTSSPTTTQHPTSQPAPTTYTETVGGNTHTWTDYSNAGGNEGATIPNGMTVQVSCKVQGFQVADGNTWWYRIASSPWNNTYYASADAFYNNGQTSGSLQGTPFVDNNVPNC